MADDELAQRCAAAMYDADLATRSLGIVISDVTAGSATARMVVTERMVNGHDLCHGGYVFLVADSAFAFACNTYNRTTVAAACDIAFLGPARRGDELVAVARERVRVGRSGVYDVTVTRGDDIVAEFRGHSRTVAGSILGPEG